MHVNEATEKFYSLLPEKPLVGISTVSQNMGERRRLYEPAGYPQFVPFGFSYNVVTDVIDDRVNAQFATGIEYYRQPQVLPVAVGRFDHKFSEPFRQDINGVEVKRHWSVLMHHELAPKIDKSMQAFVGYILHINGSDLALTVHELEQSEQFSPAVIRDYVKYDYPKIDDALAQASKKIAPILLETQNPNTQEAMTNLAMRGVKFARKAAKLDYYRLRRAKSEDHQESIIREAEQRTAKLATFIIETTYMYQGFKDHFKSGPADQLKFAA